VVKAFVPCKPRANIDLDVGISMTTEEILAMHGTIPDFTVPSDEGP
jgi:hypothetical protein